MSMVRTIVFDYEAALDRATWLFWKNGYAGTSLRGLLKAIGIGEGSFYNTMRSKKLLYVACLDRYEATEGRMRAEALTRAPDAATGIRALFDAVLNCLDRPEIPSRLCMLAAMVSEEVLADKELRARVEDGLLRMRSMLAERLARDVTVGLLPATLDPDVTASIIVTYSHGLWRAAMVNYDRRTFESQIDTLLRSLEL